MAHLGKLNARLVVGNCGGGFVLIFGWIDRFGSSAWTCRQRVYAKKWRARSVYTPGFVFNGVEWRGFFDRGQLLELPAVAKERPGVLTATSSDSTEWKIKFAGDAKREFEVHLAVMAMAEKSNVAVGENRGRSMVHDFVVLGLESVPLKIVDGQHAAKVKAPKSSVKNVSPSALAGWVSAKGDPTPVQATGGLLTRK